MARKHTKRLLVFMLILTMMLSMFAGQAKPVQAEGGAAEAEESEEQPQVISEEGITTYDDAASYGIEYEGETFQQEEPEQEDESSLLEETLPEVTEDAEIADAETFDPLSEEELASVATEVQAEIELQLNDQETEPIAEPEEESEEDIISSIFEQGENPSTSQETEVQLSGDAALANTAPKQLTMDDIYAMNPKNTVIDIYTNDGYLSTLVGKFYDKKVTNVEEGVLSIQGMAALLGLTKGCDFFAVYSEKNDKGYSFYTYQQRYGGNTLQYATLRVIVGPDGYVAGLSSSFVPNVGTASKDPAISKEAALKIVKDRFAKFNLRYYEDKTVELAVPFNANVYNCWVIYTNNPDATASFDMPYIEHYVTTDGEYLTLIPANGFATANAEVMDNSGYFKGMQVKEYSATLKLEDGTKRSIRVPVSYNPKDGKYYLMDPSRKIAVAQYYDFNYRNTVNFVTSSTVDGWSQNNLLAYANYIIAYDFYKSHGIASVDGFGTPILVTVGWCDENHTPVNNACFYGVNQGWACFGVSDVNHASDCVDVVGHEYTHGITRQSMQGTAYRNETGAINEAYSDIMGNLLEMSEGYTTDKTWLVAEKSGTVSRNMSNPNDYQQPEFIGDAYYVAPVLAPDFSVNDYGGVHINNSLVGHMAALLDQAGMSYRQQITMWLTSIELITPLSDYQDLHGALLFSLKINGMLQEYGPIVNKAFAEGGMNEDWHNTYTEAAKSGYGRVEFMSTKELANAPSQVLFATAEGKVVSRAFPDSTCRISTLLPAGTYIAQLQGTVNGASSAWNYNGNGWVKDGDFTMITVTSGQTVKLVSTDGQRPAGSSQDSKPQSGGNTQSGNLNLINFDGGYFSMLVPDGWRIEVSGQYTEFSVKIFDPNDPSTQMFYYGGLAPFHKSEAARRFWAMYDTTGIISNGPVLSSHDILGVLNSWSYCIAYQKYYDKQLFTDLNNMKLIGGNYYQGPSARLGAIESAAYISCSTNAGKDCRLLITSALIDEDYYGAYGGNWFYTCRDLCGVLAPADRYDEVFGTLVQCMASIRFTNNYILQSQQTDPMADQATISANLAWLGDIMYEVYGMYK
ncbi:MAG: M4 family metallopeptidase [Firmicutes bacterium]|nr:M4 family metallopeptidase [Bacillota bacterium]